MKYRLMIFDLDGTILDTLDDLSGALNHTLQWGGFPVRTRMEARSFIGNGIRNLIKRGAPDGTPEDVIDRLHQEFAPYYAAHSADKTGPYPGIPELLQTLRQEGVQLAVVSNKAHPAVQPLMDLYFPGLFDAAYGERPGIPRKPSPEAVWAVMEAFGASKEETVYIGDSEVDVATARNSCVDCICVDWGFRDREVLEQAGADRIASTVEELLELLR